MSSKTIKILYWIPTILLALFILPGLYFMNSEMAIQGLTHVWLKDAIWLQQILWLAGPVAILAIMIPQIPKILKERAYAGMSFIYLGAFWAHVQLWDTLGEIIMPLVTFALLILSYVMRHKLCDSTVVQK